MNFRQNFGQATAVWVLLFIACTTFDLPAQEVTVQVKSHGRKFIGQPLAFDGRDIVLMRRDGRISILPVASEDAITTVSPRFEPHGAGELRRQLQQEFGAKYQVSTTRSFVVVHPPGDFQNWATPFEDLYQRFRNYFSSRGFAVDEPQFPMVAVVLRTRGEFDRFLSTFHVPDRNTLGYYSQKSNRIITFDPTGGRGARTDWAFNATLIHEAVHQTAFNVGVHKRYGMTPTWVLEGLACMFEAKGVHNSMYHADLRDRINRDRLALLQHYYDKNRVQGKLAGFIANDANFDSDPGVAYAYSWGLTFFLAENYPTEFFRFLRDDANRKEFREYPASERTDAFQAAFGDDIAGLEKRLERFIRKL